MAIHQELTFSVRPEIVYRALTSAVEFANFTSASADIASEEGGAFSCFDNMITGRHVELNENQYIVQAWRVYNWPEGVYSIVRITLKASAEGTTLTLDHNGYPDGAEEHLEPGWHQKYWEPLKAYLN